MTYEYPVFAGDVLRAIRVWDPEHYAPFYNARISADRRDRLSTAYLAYRNDAAIGLVWSMRQWWIEEKLWHWVSPSLSVSRRGTQTLCYALWALNDHNVSRRRRQERKERDERELALMLEGLDLGF